MFIFQSISIFYVSIVLLDLYVIYSLYKEIVLRSRKFTAFFETKVQSHAIFATFLRVVCNKLWFWFCTEMCKLIICSKHRMYNFNFRLLTIWVIALAANLVFLAKFRGKFEKAMKNHLDLSLRKINSLWNHRCYTHTHILLIKLYSISKFIFLSIRCVFGPVAFNWILNLISLLITNNISVNVPSYT